MISLFANTLFPPVNKLFLSVKKFSAYMYFPRLLEVRRGRSPVELLVAEQASLLLSEDQ